MTTSTFHGRPVVVCEQRPLLCAASRVKTSDVKASVVPPVGFTFQDVDKTLHPRGECRGRATQTAFAEQESISARNYREGGTAAVHLRATRYGGHPSRVYDVSSLLGKTFACHTRRVACHP